MSKAPGRFHAARHIASLWNEEDRTTRAKMLIALGIGQRKGYGGISFGVDPGAECLRSALAREVEGLTSEQRKGVVDFVDWCAGDVESIASSSDDVVSEWVSKVKECLGKSSK